MWTSSFSVSSVNSRGASVWSTITPIVSLARERIGTATIDWKRSSSRSGKYFIRGSAIALSRMNSGWRWRATHPVSPSSRRICTTSTAAAYTGEAARIVSTPSSSR